MWVAKLLFVFAIALGAVVGIEQSKGQWALAIDVQKYYRCLPFDWYLVTTLQAGRTPSVGDLVQFKPPVVATRFTDRFEVIKLVAAVAGDQWAIRNDQLFINGELWGDLHLLRTLGEPPGHFDGAGIVPDGHIYVLGTNPSSYDSRYWGALPNTQITGYAHALL